MYRWQVLTLLWIAFSLISCNAPDAPPADPSPSEEAAETIDPKQSFVEVRPSDAPAQNDNATETQKTAAPVGQVTLPEIDPLDVRGNMVVAGSSTVFPLSSVLYERFIENGYSGVIKLESVGSGAGFRFFCQEGTADISQASRAIKQKEIDACAEIGRTPLEFRIGTDALAVVVNPENDFLADTRFNQLAKVFVAEKWSDVEPDWPEEPIQRFIPDADSGTLDFFADKVLNGDKTKMLQAPNTESNSDDEVLVQGVSTNPFAIGFVGYAYYQQNAKRLKILHLDGIAPSPENVENGTYKFARPLFLYSDRAIVRQKPQVGAFLNFFLTHVNQEIETVGYFPARPDTLDTSKRKLLRAQGQVAF